MNFKLTLTAAFATAGLLAASFSATAAPLPNLSVLNQTAAAQSQIDQVHFAHRSCRKGLNGSHKHVKGVGRIQCTTAKCQVNVFGYKVCEYY
jgi:hypothetical protein